MKYSIYLFLLIIVFASCAAKADLLDTKANIPQKSTTGKYIKCDKRLKNDFSDINELKYNTIINNDTIPYTQIIFSCGYSASYTLRTMYGYFGKWDKAIIPKNKVHPLLIWENVDVLSDNNKINIITIGEETIDFMITGFMAFDNNGKDLLKEDSLLKQSLINFFVKDLKKPKNKSKKYHKEYLKTFFPEHMENYKKWNKVN